MALGVMISCSHRACLCLVDLPGLPLPSPLPSPLAVRGGREVQAVAAQATLSPEDVKIQEGSGVLSEHRPPPKR